MDTLNKSSNRHLRVPSRNTSCSSSASFKRYTSVPERPYVDEEMRQKQLVMVNESNQMEVDSTSGAVLPMKSKIHRESGNRVHFHLNSNTLTSTDEEEEPTSDRPMAPHIVPLNKFNESLHQQDSQHFIREISNESNFTSDANMAVAKQPVVEQPVNASFQTPSKPINIKQSVNTNESKQMIAANTNNKSNKTNTKNGLEWDNDPYWDNLELNAVGKINS